MTYRDLIETFKLIAKYSEYGLDTKVLTMWAEHDEHGIGIDNPEKWSVEDIRKILSFEWLLGSDGENPLTDDEFEHPNSMSDERVKEVWKEAAGIYTYE